MVATPEQTQLFTIPADWMDIAGEDQLSGPGHTCWRYWPAASAVLIGVSHQTSDLFQESVLARAVGLHIDASTAEVLGILVQKRLKAGWTPDRRLILLKRITSLVDLAAARVITGNAKNTAVAILQDIYYQLAKSDVKSVSGRTAEDRYVRDILAQLDSGICSMIPGGVIDLISTGVVGESSTIHRMKSAVQ